MVVQTAAEATGNALAYTRCDSGQCLRYTRTWLEIPSRDYSAREAWDKAVRKHPGDRHPPRGAPVFWGGGSRGFGHIGLSLMSLEFPRFRGTDMPFGGLVSSQALGWVEEHWGMPYLGWAEDLNGVLIPYLDHRAPPPPSRWAVGAVYVANLFYGNTDSDSVRRLQFRLLHYTDIHSAGVSVTGYYGDRTRAAVQFYQHRIIPSVPGPKDGLYLSDQQARALFSANHQLIPKDTT